MNEKKLISFYAYGLFIFLMICAFISSYPIYLLSHLWSKKPRVYLQKMVQQYFKLFYFLLPLVGKITINNKKYINKFHPCVYVSTHQSSLDYTLLATMIDDYATPSNHFISDYPLFLKIPRDGLGIYYIPKGNLNDANIGYQKLKEALEKKSSVIIFAEGTRNPSNQLKRFKRGAFRLAIAQNVPIVPIIIDGTGKIVAKDSNITKTIKKQDIQVTFLKPIYPKENETIQEFTNEVKDIMQQFIDNTKGSQ